MYYLSEKTVIISSIGKWIDQSKRLKAARIFLATQNISTALSCILLALYFAKVRSIRSKTCIKSIAYIQGRPSSIDIVGAEGG